MITEPHLGQTGRGLARKSSARCQLAHLQPGSVQFDHWPRP
jgi:hypothetical protein